jgi:hypothetical protein
LESDETEKTSTGTVDAAACPALKKIVKEPAQKKLDEGICPV